MDSSNTFIRADSLLPPRPTDATLRPSSPEHAAIHELAAFPDILERNIVVRMANKLITFFQTP